MPSPDSLQHWAWGKSYPVTQEVTLVSCRPSVHLSQSGLLRATVSDGKVEHAFALPDSASRRPRWKTAARDDPASVLAESCRDTPTWQLQAPSAGGSWVRASQQQAEALELTDTRHLYQRL